MGRRFTLCLTAFSFVTILLAPRAFGAADDVNQELEKSIFTPVQADYVQNLNLSQEDKRFLDLVKADKFQEARESIVARLKHGSSPEQTSELLSMQACLDLRRGNEKLALKELRNLLGTANQDKNVSPTFIALLHQRIGDVLRSNRRLPDAISEYKTALASDTGLSSANRLLVLEPLVGCLVQNNDYIEARKYGEDLLALCQLPENAGKLKYAIALFWSRVQLMQIYSKLGDTEKADAMRESHEKFFDQLLALRDKFYASLSAPTSATKDELQKLAAFRRTAFSIYMNDSQPKSFSEFLWVASEFRLRTLPLIRWQPADGDAKLVLLCIHGLGLENRAFEFFARDMNKRQCLVYALDVRGFGAWQSEFGNEAVSFDRALTDIRSVIKILERRHPGLPVFLVGESMGGAIALRAASEYGGEFAGVVSSVPSADRYGNKKMAAEVAMHLLKGANTPFDIGTQVASQATSSQDLIDVWAKDSKSKMKLSSIELIKFDRFMHTTEKKCSLIQKTPVMIVQGMADNLVKPKGSYDMFDAVKSPDKAMVILGNAEHLIFETPNQSKVLLDGLGAWLSDHAEAKTPNHAAVR